MIWQLRDRILDCSGRALVMGILNVTPDSFSDGGRFIDADAAVARGLQMVADGADLLDVGGESTRPGSQPVSPEDELNRVVPVVAALARQTDRPISVDTSKAVVARQCLEAGAHIINDVTALRGDAGMPEVVRQFRAGVVLMHMQGTPATMQDAPSYTDVVGEIGLFFAERLGYAESVGIAREQAVLDPGIGFGKTTAHNLEILARLSEFRKLGRPVLLGVSRKGFSGRILGRPVEQRLAGSLAAACYGLAHQAAHIIRAHDVPETRDAVVLLGAIAQAGTDPA